MDEIENQWMDGDGVLDNVDLSHHERIVTLRRDIFPCLRMAHGRLISEGWGLCEWDIGIFGVRSESNSSGRY